LGSEALITLVEYNKLLACRREEFLAVEIISKYHKHTNTERTRSKMKTKGRGEEEEPKKS
jgi:hypothetical protein